MFESIVDNIMYAVTGFALVFVGFLAFLGAVFVVTTFDLRYLIAIPAILILHRIGKVFITS